jgi:Family of unknown function (DUF6252)
MKNILTLTTMAAMALAAFTGCKKSSSSSYTMSATINGHSFSTSGSTYVTAAKSTTSISGTDSKDAVAIALGLNSLSTGTYTLGSGASAITIDSGITAASSAVYGTVIITSSNSSTVSGTFNFTCYDSTKVTNGSFTAKVY